MLGINLVNRKKRAYIEKLSFLSLIKFVAVIVIIYQHILYSAYKGIDLGGRMVEIIFISSGFLIGYNYSKKDIKAKIKNSFSILLKKLVSFYPLHLIVLIIVIILEFMIGIRSNLDSNFYISLAMNLTLTQAWSLDPNVLFSFNGVAWFLSALLFCYFFSPFLLQGIKKFKISIILLCSFIFVRIMVEFLITKYSNVYFINFHTNPLIKLNDFYIGMLTVPLFNLITQKLDKYRDRLSIKISFTFVELLIPISIILIMYFGEGILLRGIFVTIFAFFIMLSAFNYGYISLICSTNILEKIFSYQFEMYMFQIPVFYALHIFIVRCGIWYVTNDYLSQFIIKLIIIFMVAFVYKEYCSKPIDKGTKFLVNKIQSTFARSH